MCTGIRCEWILDVFGSVQAEMDLCGLSRLRLTQGHLGNAGRVGVRSCGRGRAHHRHRGEKSR